MLRWLGFGVGMVLFATRPLSAQVLGTFTWQMQPFCNKVTLTVTGTPTGFTVHGSDDLCGGFFKAGAVGMATFNGDGTVQVNFSIVLPQAQSVDISARVSPLDGNGFWNSSAGISGSWRFFASTPGLPPRPDGDHVYVRATSHQSGAFTSGPVLWSGITHTTTNIQYDSTSGVFTVPSSGLYFIAYSVGWATNGATTGRVCASIRTTSTPNDMSSCVPVANAPFVTLTGSTMTPLGSGHTIQILTNGIPTGPSLLPSGSGITILRIR